MNDFTASNGLRLIQRGGGSTYDLLSPDGDNMFEGAEWLGSQDMHALREFFQAEADERLGRWRWPENTHFVVYPPRPGFSAPDGCDLFVMNELWGSALGYVDSEFASYDEEDRPFADAGRAYFDAHPEPKPWHDAAEGEVWILMFPNTSHAWFVNGDYFQSTKTLTNIAKTDPGITAGRRILPEVS